MSSYIGSHGTTTTRAESILEKGFELKPGRAGNGAYFWRKSPYYINLAKGWYNFFKFKDYYSDDKDNSCAVIEVKLLIYNKRKCYE